MKKINQRKLELGKEPEKNLNENELINSNKRLQKQTKDLERSINNY